MKKSSSLLPALLAGALCAGSARGATVRPQTAPVNSVPGGINYQGRLNQNGVPVTASNWAFVFRVYPTATGGTPIATLPPSGSISADIVSGLFSVTVPVTTDTLVGGNDRWLEVEIDAPHASPQVMTPREKLYSVP